MVVDDTTRTDLFYHTGVNALREKLGRNLSSVESLLRWRRLSSFIQKTPPWDVPPPSRKRTPPSQERTRGEVTAAETFEWTLPGPGPDDDGAPTWH